MSEPDWYICHRSIKVMDGHVILDIFDRCIKGCLTPHLIDQPKVEHVAPLLLLHWGYIEDVFLWVPIVLIWNSNMLTCLNLVICGIPSNKSTYRPHYLHWDMDIKICLNSQWPMLIDRVITYWYSESSALIGVYWFFSTLLTNHKPWPNTIIMTSPGSIVYGVAPVHIGIFTCSEYSARKGVTVHYSGVNDISRISLPKQYVSG